MTLSRRHFAFGIWVVTAVATASHQSRNAVARAQSCSFTVSPARVETEGPAQSGTVAVETQGGCTWTVSAAASWVQLDRAGGTGPGVIGYTVETLVPPAPFRGDPIRQTTIQVRWNTPTLGQNVLVTQVAARCNAAIGFEGSATFGPRVARGRLRVLAESFWSGPWYIKSAPDWITFTSPPLGVFGRGDGDAYFSLSPNPGTTPRDGVIETCGGTEYIRQAGRSQREGPYVRGDFDDDGIADLVVFRTPPIVMFEPPGLWFVLRSSTNYSYAEHQTIAFGNRGGTPFPLKPSSATSTAMARPIWGWRNVVSGRR